MLWHPRPAGTILHANDRPTGPLRMNTPDLRQERARLAAYAMDLTGRRGGEVTPEILAAEVGVSRARIEAIFPEESDLFDAVVELWFEPHVAIMEEVLASDLPPNRKFYEFYVRRFRRNRTEFRRDPSAFAVLCELGARRFERVRSFVDLADHYLCELIAEAQAEGHFPGLEIDRALTLINQMTVAYTMPDLLQTVDERLTEDKLAAIVDTLFAGLSAADGGASGVSGLRPA